MDNSQPAFYQAGECNLNSASVTRRLIGAILSGIVGAASIIYLYSIHANLLVRYLDGAVFAMLFLLYYDQLRAKFCVVNGYRGTYEQGLKRTAISSADEKAVDRAKAVAMFRRVVWRGLLLGLIGIVPL